MSLAPSFSAMAPNDSNLTGDTTPTMVYTASTQDITFGEAFDAGLTAFKAGWNELTNNPVKFVEDAANVNTASTGILPGNIGSGSWSSLFLIGIVLIVGYVFVEHYIND